eukprot:12532-Pleurochrysis_carterae.AAC.1
MGRLQMHRSGGECRTVATLAPPRLLLVSCASDDLIDAFADAGVDAECADRIAHWPDQWPASR